MISVDNSGSFKNLEDFLNRVSGGKLYANLNRYGQQGVDALRSATPIDSGLTAESWGYRVIKSARNPGIEWFNTHEEDGVNIAILIQYGHGTGTGGYVTGVDYINPAIRPIFDKIVEDIWRQVTA